MLLGVGVAAIAATGILGLRGRRMPPGGTLITLEKADRASDSGKAGRTYIAFAASGAPSLRDLTDDFYDASSPSPSHDGLRLLFVGSRASSEAPAIWERGVNGSGLRQVSAGYGHPADPIYLADGRILFGDHPPGSIPEVRSLFSCAPDGSGLQRLTFGDHADTGPGLLPDGRIRFRRRLLSPGPHSILDVVIHPDGTGMSAFVSSERASTTTDELPPVKPPAGTRLIAGAPAGPWDLPAVLTSVVQPDRKTGTLLCLNAYASRIPSIAALPPGAIRRVRVSALDGGGEEKLSGEAKVESDGSFFVEVPADTPLRIHLLGEGDKVLASFQSGIWVRPNENRACLGCHEDPDLSPENRQPLALQGGPVSLGLTLTPKGEGGGS